MYLVSFTCIEHFIQPCSYHIQRGIENFYHAPKLLFVSSILPFTLYSLQLLILFLSPKSICYLSSIKLTHLTLEHTGGGSGGRIPGGGKSAYNFRVSPAYPPSPLLFLWVQPAVDTVVQEYILAGNKNPCTSGPMQFKPMLFKGLL